MSTLEFNLLAILVIVLLCFLKFFLSTKEELKHLRNRIRDYGDLFETQCDLVNTKEQTISELEQTINSLQLQITCSTNTTKKLSLAPPSFVEDNSIVVENIRNKILKNQTVFTRKQKERILELYNKNLIDKQYSLNKLVAILNKEFNLNKPYNYYRNIWKTDN